MEDQTQVDSLLMKLGCVLSVERVLYANVNDVEISIARHSVSEGIGPTIDLFASQCRK